TPPRPPQGHIASSIERACPLQSVTASRRASPLSTWHFAHPPAGSCLKETMRGAYCQEAEKMRDSPVIVWVGQSHGPHPIGHLLPTYGSEQRRRSGHWGRSQNGYSMTPCP